MGNPCKASKDNIVLVKPYVAAFTKTMKHVNADFIISRLIHTTTNDLKSVSSLKEIAN